MSADVGGIEGNIDEMVFLNEARPKITLLADAKFLVKVAAFGEGSFWYKYGAAINFALEEAELVFGI